MKNSLCLKASSFSYPSDICIPDNIVPMPNQTAWRGKSASRSCALDGNNQNTGYVHYAELEEYNITTGNATGNTKPNSPSDPNYIPDYQDTNLCSPPAQAQPVTLQVGMSDGGNGRFSYVAVLGQALSVPFTVNFTAQYRQNNIDKAANPLSIVIPAGQTAVTVIGDAYGNDPVTAYHTQVISYNPNQPDGKNITPENYDGTNQTGELN